MRWHEQAQTSGILGTTLGWLLHAQSDAHATVESMLLQDITSAVDCHEHVQTARHPREALGEEEWRYVLLAIDGTWRQAKEMYKVCSHGMTESASLCPVPLLASSHAARACSDSLKSVICTH